MDCESVTEDGKPSSAEEEATKVCVGAQNDGKARIK